MPGYALKTTEYELNHGLLCVSVCRVRVGVPCACRCAVVRVYLNVRMRCSCAFQQFRCADVLTGKAVTLEFVDHFDLRRFDRPAAPARHHHQVGCRSIL
jgi:hypothetical protein